MMAPISSLSLSIGTQASRGHARARARAGRQLPTRQQIGNMTRSAWSGENMRHRARTAFVSGCPAAVRHRRAARQAARPIESPRLRKAQGAKIGLADARRVLQHRSGTPASSSPGELEMTFSTSEVAVCCSRASDSCLRVSACSRRSSRSCFSKSVRVEMRRSIWRRLTLRRRALPTLPPVVARRFIKARPTDWLAVSYRFRRVLW